MIEFHLREKSGVPTYLQIVQQARQAIRLGILQPGDQLPTVKDVVGSLAINPNTVLKAYRELDLEGLVEGRRGVGTFVASDVTSLPRDDVAELRSALEAWVARARKDGPRRRDPVGTLRRRAAAARPGKRRMSPMALQTADLGKRYGSTWALRDCTLEIPAGTVTALVGPNGAGKTTLLQLAIGLTTPTTGRVQVVGLAPRRDARSLLPKVGFVGQEHPLHPGFTLAETLRLGRSLNPHWDNALAVARLNELGLSLDHKVGRLSGGQQAQVALTLAIAKRPELLLLDEPVAAVDPLARRDFLTTLMEAVAETGMTVLLFSTSRRPRACLRPHRDPLARPNPTQRPDRRGARKPPAAGRPATRRRHDRPRPPPVRERHTARQTALLVRAGGHVYDHVEQREVDLEEIVLAYLDQGSPRATPGRRSSA